MGIQNNSFTLFFPNAGLVMGTVATDGTLSNLTGSNGIQRGLVSCVKNGTGDLTITITDFKGPRGIAIGFGNALSAGIIVNPQAATYSNNTVSVEFLLENGSASATDSIFNFQIWAY